jgi:hypothetical protein
MSITYPFTPFNSVFKKNMLQSKVTLREYKVWDGVSYLAYSFPETRDTLTITTTCRQIGELICLPFQHVATALQKLARRGLITILKKGFWGKDGEREPSIIQLNTVTNSVTHENSNNKQKNKSVTHQVTKTVTPASNQNGDTPKKQIKKEHDMIVSFINSNSNFSTKEKTKQPVTSMSAYIAEESIPITFKKEENKQQEKTNFDFTMGAGGFNNNVNNNTYNKQSEEKGLSSLSSILGSIPLPQKEQPQAVNTPQNIPTPVTAPTVTNNSDLSSLGVQEKALFIGVNELKKRNIVDIPSTISALGTLLRGKKNIQNPSGYFVKLCKEISLETLFKPVSTFHSEHIAGEATPVQKTRRAVEEFWKEERTAIPTEEVLRTLSKTCPDKLYAVITDVNSDKKIQRGLSFMPEDGEARKLALENIILSEFKKRYPDIIV